MQPFDFFPDHGLVIWWVNCYVVPRPFNGRFLMERFGEEQGSDSWFQAFRDLRLHQVVDNSLLLMVLSVPASPQIFLEVQGGPLTRDTPRSSYPGVSGCLRELPKKHAFGSGSHVNRFERSSSGLVRPISIMQSSCCEWGNNVFSSTCVVTSRGFLSPTTPKVQAWRPAFQQSGFRVQAFTLARVFHWDFLGGGPKPFPVLALGHQPMDIPRVCAF